MAENVRKLAEESAAAAKDVGALIADVQQFEGTGLNATRVQAGARVVAATREQTSTMEGMASTAQGLTGMAEELAALAAEFKLGQAPAGPQSRP